MRHPSFPSITHLLTCVGLFIVIAACAVLLDVLAMLAGTYAGISRFTCDMLTMFAHAMLVLDLTLLFAYLIRATAQQIRHWYA